MDISRSPGQSFNSPGSLGSLPEYIITNFFPGARPLLARYPSLFKLAALFSALYYLVPLSRIKALWTEFSSVFMSTIIIHSDEDLFEYLIDHFSSIKTLRADHTLIASTESSASNPRMRRRYSYASDSDAPSSTLFSSKAKPKVKYETSQGFSLFVHDRCLLLATRRDTNQNAYGGGRSRAIEALSVSCLGRNAAPIKTFLESVYTAHSNKEKIFTVIRRPQNDGYRDQRGWSRVTAKPRRQMDTVILDQSQKQSIVDDVTEYVDSETRQFYGSHGIPYRRGYLFYGPPGTGKTSFALALAAKFEMDVYVMSLLEREIGDSELIALLNQLPAKSLLLLEDVDTAGLGRKQVTQAVEDNTDPLGSYGLKRRDSNTNNDDDDADDDSSSEDEDDVEIEEDPKFKKPQSRVTLSGLLNAIDGVAAPEGHILIMTTNRPDELDEALVRAGRISVRVGFRLASKAVAEGLFLKMYLPHGVKDSLTGEGGGMKDVVVSFDKINTAHREHEHVVRRLAREFAAKIDDDEFSPADLQDYFLGRKKDPCKAVNDVMILKDETEKEKERKIRLLAKMRVRRRRDGDVGRKIKNKKKKKIEKE